ncbi:hypothetical protein BDZ94DRAFT_1272111 [Collybia nuda]|uniref:Uncharacterized protein n=1 Tax=Collybia nuda TaxID=64659 RepID=A0A9P5XY58_9AGAR|nr:hypothetical protein BDZ94DRAFT_1272111 [Collybia nuda]
MFPTKEHWAHTYIISLYIYSRVSWVSFKFQFFPHHFDITQVYTRTCIYLPSCITIWAISFFRVFGGFGYFNDHDDHVTQPK